MGRKPRRISNETAIVIALFLADPTREWYGLEIISAAQIPSGSVYPILIRLEDRGILSSRLESGDETALERRRRRYYCLGRPGGAERAREALAEWQATAERRRIAWLPLPAPLGASR